MAKSLLSQQNQEQHLPCLPWGSVRTTPAPQSQVLARSKSAPWVRGSLLLTLQVRCCGPCKQHGESRGSPL